MIGNQHMLNSILLEHEANPIKKKIGDKEALDVIYMITDEYWKEWRRQMTNSQKPVIYAPGLGQFSLMYGKSKTYLRKILKKLKGIKETHPDNYLIEGTFAHGYYNNLLLRFRNTWKQVDLVKKHVNYRYAAWRQKKIDKYGDKAIL